MHHHIRSCHGLLVACLFLCVVISSRAHSQQDLYFPDEKWEHVRPADVGWDAEKLKASIDFAMSNDSSGVVVVHGGRILAERYQILKGNPLAYKAMLHGKTTDGRAIEDVASVQKSVVSFLVGIAIEKGLVKLSDPVVKHLGEGWSQVSRERESAIELKHLISMNSGLNARLRFEAKPDTRWKYNTRAYSKSLSVISAASKLSPNELTQKWLTERIGMRETKWVQRSSANDTDVDANRWGLSTTARDLAKFGLLVQAGGAWNGQAILGDRDYLKAALSTSQKQKPQYGYLWWLNSNGDLAPSAPRDLVAAMGALGRKCYVVPSMNLVVTRLGASPRKTKNREFDREFWRMLMKASPK